MDNTSENMNINNVAQSTEGTPDSVPAPAVPKTETEVTNPGVSGVNGGYQAPAPQYPSNGYGAYQQPQVRQPYNSAPQGGYYQGGYPLNGYQGQQMPPYGYRPQQPVNPYVNRPQSPVNPYGNYPQQPTPAMIYYSSQTGTAPQYHYGNPTWGGVIHNQYFDEQNRRAEVKANLTKRLKYIGNLVGGASLFTIVFTYVLMFVLGTVASIAGPNSVFAQVYNSFWTTVSGSSLLQIVYTLTVVGGSFWIFRRAISHACVNDINTQPKQFVKNKLIHMPLKMPKGGARIPLLILISFGGCMLANYVCIILSTFYSSFGLSPTSAPGPEVQSVWDLLARFVSTAIVPALIEELALRGAVMTPLRKYGNGFAIVFSAFVFGIFHGDLDQIPFAFICGLFMGYAVVMTESLWTGVIIHAMNNSISCIQEAIMYYTKLQYDDVEKATEAADSAGGSFFLLLSAIAIVAGVIALIVYLKKYKAEDKPKLKSTNTLMNTTQMFKAVTASPAMIVSIIIFCLTAVADRIPV